MLATLYATIQLVVSHCHGFGESQLSAYVPALREPQTPVYLYGFLKCSAPDRFTDATVNLSRIRLSDGS